MSEPIKETSEDFIGSDFLKEKLIKTSPYNYIYNGNIIGRPFSLEDFIRRDMKFMIPNKLGIYHLFHEDRLVYIGMSKNLRSRLIGHLKDTDMIFNYVLWFVTEPQRSVKETFELERKMIKKIKPIFNIQYSSSAA